MTTILVCLLLLLLSIGDFDYFNALRVMACLFIILSHTFYMTIDTNMYENQREVAVGYHGHTGMVVVVVVKEVVVVVVVVVLIMIIIVVVAVAALVIIGMIVMFTLMTIHHNHDDIDGYLLIITSVSFTQV